MIQSKRNKKAILTKKSSGVDLPTKMENNHILPLFVVIILLSSLVIFAVHKIPYHAYSTGATGATTSYEVAKVLEVTEETLDESQHLKEIKVGQQTLKVKLLSGPHKNETLTAKNYLSTYNSVIAVAGKKLIVIVDSLSTGEYQLRVYNYYRAPMIYIMVAVFLLALALVGGRKGVLSGFGLIYTFVCVVFVFMPLVVRGVSPVWSAVLLVAMVTTASMTFINGISKKSLCAVIGTIGGVLLAGMILFVFNSAMHLSGLNTEDTESLMLISQTTGLKVKDLLFAGILVASLGAVMDIAMSVVAALFEMHDRLRDISSVELFKMGMNIGKDMIGTMSNTLILAFAGTSLNMMIILYSYSIQYNQLLNMNMIAIEIVQALSGSLAVILTVPLTAAFAAWLLKSRKHAR